MRIQILAFVPPAAVITGILLFLTSSIVSALDASLSPMIAPDPRTLSLDLSDEDGDCDFLARRHRQVLEDLESCDANPGCLRFPLLCSVEMHDDLRREEQALRSVAEQISCSPVEDRVLAANAEAAEGWGVQLCGTPAADWEDSQLLGTFLF